MSIVRYTDNSSTSSDGLTIVHRNAQSNSLVVYNSDTNSFQLVNLDGYNDSSRSFHFDSSDNYTDFVCANCGYVNHLGMHPHKRRRGSDEDTTRRISQRRGISADRNNDTTEEEADDEYVSDTGSRKRRISNVGSVDLPIIRGARRLGDGDLGNYITTSSGDLLRGDYFRLLAKIDGSMKSSRELVKKVMGTENTDNVSPSRNKIPYELINQGYFSKFFKVLKELGNGSNGKVFKVEHELMDLNLGVFALKKIAIGDDVGNLVRILNEVKFLYNLSDNAYESSTEPGSGNIVRYNHVWLEIDQVSKFGPKVPVIFILYEYCDGGDLETFIDSIANPQFDLKKERLFRRLRRLSETERGKKLIDPSKLHQEHGRYLNNYEIYKIFNDAVNGLNYLHKMKIIHRDLKPSNCLFKSKFPDDYEPIGSVDELDRIPTLLVSDFGESIMENTRRSSTGSTGTLEYCAPELFELDETRGRLKEFTHSSDVYSLGMILYYLCFNSLPFKSSSPVDIREEIGRAGLLDRMEKIRPLDGKERLLKDWIVLIKKMVNSKMEERPTASELVAEMRQIYEKLKEDQAEKVVTEVVLVNKPSRRPRYALLIILGLTVINVWLFRDWPYVVNAECLSLGLALSPGTRRYITAVKAALLAYGVANALGMPRMR
ncbi:DEKNAAC102092 [Brettanomyces naardenensis]|uniref:DEKNAAC102092 n=1 Tax=Brettanomyces naardenensis TaxID=13370 RepID=A0A448YJL4_BRENA|nr:DEKNAAC102092 [Brettanomyces naardenensis]